ncbi:MAG: hypothetical protein M1833_005182 [Piccolia ochrophora]|nr:MAG: hypothetical protein M1833_005182 [Piccolia ochrophora]
MASKTATTLAGVYHPAGIYADMSVDGPEIGDLVVVVDKAKNLPNRKTIGKQDPYCAARLGKNQARKTETDKRGGQTPRWDQELRFTVHDSPDYNQLKVSVFNDDKRTDLIGETWVNLDQVVVRGGGRADGWHGLNCKGRYAGEIRIELTYYDIRPKEDSAADRTREVGRGMSETNGRESLGGPRQLTQPSRRPLPSNPMNGSPGHMGIQDHWQSSNGPDPYGQTEPRYAPDHQYLASNARPIPPQRHSEPVAAYHPPLSSRVSTQALRMEQMPQTSPLHFHPELNGPLESDIGHGYTAQESFGASDALPGNQLEFYQPMESSRQEFHSMPHPSRAEDRQRSQRQRGSPHPPGSHSQRTSPSIPPPLSHTQTAPAGMQHSQAATLYDRQGYSRDLGEYQDLNGGDFHSNDARGCGSRSRREDAYHSPYGEGRDLVHTTADDQGPPPPPAHRSSGNLVSTYQQSANDSFSHAQPPAPLNVSNNRTSMSHAYHNTRPDVREGSAPPVSPATYQGYSPNGTSPASRSPLDGLRRRSGDAMAALRKPTLAQVNSTLKGDATLLRRASVRASDHPTGLQATPANHALTKTLQKYPKDLLKMTVEEPIDRRLRSLNHGPSVRTHEHQRGSRSVLSQRHNQMGDDSPVSLSPPILMTPSTPIPEAVRQVQGITPQNDKKREPVPMSLLS